MAREREDEVSNLAAYILGKATRQRPRMTSPSTISGGNVLDDRRDGIPLPIGTEDQVLTIVDVGAGLLVPAWADPTGGGGGGGTSKYRQFMISRDGSGGWGFVSGVIDSQAYPIMLLLDTE